MATVAAAFIIIWLICSFEVSPAALMACRTQATIWQFRLQFQKKLLLSGFSSSYPGNYFAVNITRTRVGRAFVAIRDNDLAAEVMGISLWNYKLQAFFIGCVYAGIAGSLLVHYYGLASVDQFPFIDSVWYVGMLIVGGMGSVTGAILGAVSLRLLDELVTAIGPILSAGIAAQAAAAVALITRGLIIIVFLIYDPRGLVHLWHMVEAYFRLWPFSHEETE